MKTRWLFMVAAFGFTLAGCSDDLCIICERLEECGAINKSDIDRCVEELESADVSDNAAEDCADCADSKTCNSIAAGECEAACASFGAMLGG